VGVVWRAHSLNTPQRQRPLLPPTSPLIHTKKVTNPPLLPTFTFFPTHTPSRTPRLYLSLPHLRLSPSFYSGGTHKLVCQLTLSCNPGIVLISIARKSCHFRHPFQHCLSQSLRRVCHDLSCQDIFSPKLRTSRPRDLNQN
jgi:hypothetical protein